LSRRLLLTATLLVLAGTPVFAQQAVTSAFSGFSGKSDAPVKIEADKLDVREKDQAAIFSGKVFVEQNGSTLRARQLTILYDNTPAPAGTPQVKAATPAAGAASPMGRNIRRLEAEGNVQVASGEQKATGDRGVFDMPNNKVTLTGNVVVVQGQNILKGERLVVDLTTQQSRLEGASGGSGRVQGVFSPGQAKPAP
jgi:lipopolysaccharide export system protein LptA